MLKRYYLVCRHCANIEHLYDPNEYTICSFCNSPHIVLLTGDHYSSRLQQFSKQSTTSSGFPSRTPFEETLLREFVYCSEFYDPEVAHNTALYKGAIALGGLPKRIVCPQCNSASVHDETAHAGTRYVTYKYRCYNCHYEWTRRI